MAWVDELLIEIRTLITEDWKLDDDERMQHVCSLYIQARLDHARDTEEAPYSEQLKIRFAEEFAQMLREARGFESADLLRDSITNALFALPVVCTQVEAAQATGSVLTPSPFHSAETRQS